jgi:hypothetical protein
MENTVDMWMELLSWVLITVALFVAGVGARVGESWIILLALPIVVVALFARIKATNIARRK